ncbi:hypothetical protein CR513_30980, partial [Mucuna pruriens]
MESNDSITIKDIEEVTTKDIEEVITNDRDNCFYKDKLICPLNEKEGAKWVGDRMRTCQRTMHLLGKKVSFTTLENK